MSKRHQASRRKAYGRRQHELRERHERIRLARHAEFAPDGDTDAGATEPLAFLDPRTTRLHYALGD